MKIICEKIKERKNPSSNDDDPLKILKVRFAKGEISKEEYDEIESVLEWSAMKHVKIIAIMRFRNDY